MEDYKKQIDLLQTEKTELVNQKNKFEYEYKHMRSKIESYEMAHSRDMETIHLLEDRLRELELGEGKLIIYKPFLFLFFSIDNYCYEEYLDGFFS